MTEKQRLIINTWDNWDGERSYRKVADSLMLKPRYVNEVIHNREEIKQSRLPVRKKNVIPCLRCNRTFASEHKFNRLCEFCRGYIGKYGNYLDTYGIGSIE